MYHKRDLFGVLKNPAVAYANHRQMVVSGFTHPDRTWAQVNAEYRKKLRKKKIARLSRRANRGR